TFAPHHAAAHSSAVPAAIPISAAVPILIKPPAGAHPATAIATTVLIRVVIAAAPSAHALQALQQPLQVLPLHQDLRLILHLRARYAVLGTRRDRTTRKKSGRCRE